MVWAHHWTKPAQVRSSHKLIKTNTRNCPLLASDILLVQNGTKKTSRIANKTLTGFEPEIISMSPVLAQRWFQGISQGTDGRVLVLNCVWDTSSATKIKNGNMMTCLGLNLLCELSQVICGVDERHGMVHLRAYMNMQAKDRYIVILLVHEYVDDIFGWHSKL